MRLSLIAVTLVLVCLCTESVRAQSRGTTGGTGAISSGGISSGSISSGGISSGSVSSGSVSSGNSGIGMAGGQTTTGFNSQLSTGMTTSSTGQTAGGTGSTGTTGGGAAGGGGAGGNTAGGTPGFVGGNASQNFIGGARQATNQQNSNRQFQAFQNSQIAPNSQSQQSSTPRQIRTTMSIGFNFPAASDAQRAGKLANANSLSLNRFISTRPEFADVSVDLASDGTAVLTGLSPSIESSRLAANLIRLQPGVRKVNNQIAVNR